ncbi:MAG: hypothetical protein M0P31_09590 [Solirubrobacteraceae bacterium]|nr:hypothetical protein [Solirubrobacteraceae bacterium]
MRRAPAPRPTTNRPRSRRRTARAALAAVLAAVACLVAGPATTIAATPAGADPGPLPATSGPGPIADLARHMAMSDARWWGDHQKADGSFVERLDRSRARNGYGRLMLGYGMYRTAALLPATDPDRGPLVDGGRRAVIWVNNGASEGFRALAILALLRDVAPGSAEVRAWAARYLRRFTVTQVGARARGCKLKPSCYTNLKLVEALDILQLLDTDLTSTVPGSRLATRSASRRWARDIVNVRIPRVADGRLRMRTPRGVTSGSVLSDPPNNPLAYHALSTWLLATAVEQLGPSARPQAVKALRRTLDALTALVGPDGDISWYGRGQAQVWTVAMTAAAGAQGARYFARRDPIRARRYLALTRLALERLRDRHRKPTGLLALVDTQRLTDGASTTIPHRNDTRGIDKYAGDVVYGGLGQLALWQAIDALDDLDPTMAHGDLPVEGELRVLDPKATRMAVVRHEDVWFAVHAENQHRTDLRYDAGLLRLKRRGPDGIWTDLLAARPRTETDTRTLTAAPAMVWRDRFAYPVGTRMQVTSTGRVIVRGGYRLSRTRWLRRGITWTYEPLSNGLKLTVRGLPRGARLRHRVFATEGGLRVTAADDLRADNAIVSFRPRPRRRFKIVEGRFHSAPLPNLSLANVTTGNDRGRASVTYRAWSAKARPASEGVGGESTGEEPPGP